MRNIINNILKKFDLEVVKKQNRAFQMPVELTLDECKIIDYVISNKLTMVSYERAITTLMAVKHAISSCIQGDFVEAGVWRGGNSLIAAAMFKLYGVKKKVWLFDTFKGMTAPTDIDIQASNLVSAKLRYQSAQHDDHNEWCYSSLDDVKSNFLRMNLLSENIIFVEGDVCQTLTESENIPTAICCLRLDTDWYESTFKELEVLYPRLSEGGSLILDDYGHWSGAKKATDEYFSKHKNRPFLQYTDYTGRVAVKVL